MTLVVNLYGGPGTGKSTNAARLFTMLKDEGIEVELVTEYAKDLVWEDRMKTLDNQLYVFAKQHHRINRLLGKVDVIITDSPLLLSVLYGRLNNNISETFEKLVCEVHSEMNTLDVFLNRVEPYNPNGRLQTEEEAKKIDATTKNLLEEYCLVSWYEFEGSAAGCESIFSAIKTALQ